MQEVLSQNSRESMKILVSHTYPGEPENRKARVMTTVCCDPETLQDIYDRKAESIWEIWTGRRVRAVTMRPWSLPSTARHDELKMTDRRRTHCAARRELLKRNI